MFKQNYCWMEPLLSNFCESRLYIIFVNVKGHGFSLASERKEVYLTATIQGNCSRRSEVAAKFPEMVR